MDFYQTISQPTQHLFKEKGSKFLAFAYSVQSEEEFKLHLEVLKKQYYDATHHCYAFELASGQKRANDDGEPSGTAGLPILQQIQSKNLKNTAVVVVRYFGGTKLGASGLVAAYKTAAKELLDLTPTKTVYLTQTWLLKFPLSDIGQAMRTLKEVEANILTQQFSDMVEMQIEVKVSNTNTLLRQLTYPFEVYQVQ